METFKKVWSVVSTILVVIVVLCAVFLMGSRIVGYEVYTVLSGSMEPTYSPGDLLYVKAVEKENVAKEVKVGDPVTFVVNQDLVVATHRVVRIDLEKKVLYTKGDANEIEDSSPVSFGNVRGVVHFSIPLLGYVSNFIQNPPGMYITIAAGAVLIILVFLPDFLPKKKEEESEESAAQQEENERLKAELEALKAQLEQKDNQV